MWILFLFDVVVGDKLDVVYQIHKSLSCDVFCFPDKITSYADSSGIMRVQTHKGMPPFLKNDKKHDLRDDAATAVPLSLIHI